MAAPGAAAARGRPAARAARGPGGLSHRARSVGRAEPAGDRAGALRERLAVTTPLGAEAELVPERGRPWRVLLRLDGEDCSHVDLRDSTQLDFAYVRRLGDLADLVAPPRRSIAALHLGGGAFTLPRYVARTRPRSRQVAVELDPGLVDLAREHLELHTGPELKVRVADAGLVLARRSAHSVDLLVLDAFRGTTVPAHLVSADAVAQAARVLRPGGFFAVNVIDDPPLPLARAIARTLAGAFPHLGVVAARKVLKGRQGGNVVLVAAHRGLPTADLARRALRGAAPELVLGEADAAAFAS